MGCFPVDFQEVKRPLRTKSVKRPIKVGNRPINEGKRPIKAKVLVGVSVGCLMGCFRAPPPWRKTAPLKRPIERSMILCQWEKETEIIAACCTMSHIVVTFFAVPFPPSPFGFRRLKSGVNKIDGLVYNGFQARASLACKLNISRAIWLLSSTSKDKSMQKKKVKLFCKSRFSQPLLWGNHKTRLHKGQVTKELLRSSPTLKIL